jgi:predicted nuclease of predicted toxin-antitoxin system
MSAFLLKLDENLSQAHMDLLNGAGYSAERVTDEGLSGADDAAVWQRACSEGRLFLTLDLDFADVRRFPPGSHPGILLLRPRNRSRDAILEILERILREQPLNALAGCFVVADIHHTRIRRPPPLAPPAANQGNRTR